MKVYTKPIMEVIDLAGENILLASCQAVCEGECAPGVFVCNAECNTYCAPECQAAGTDS